MKPISCAIIRDILPLYLDDVVSADTRDMVEEHLAQCSDCREEAARLKKAVALPVSREIRLSQARALQQIKARFFKKKVVLSVISAAAAIALLFGLYAYAVLSQSCIPYDSGAISVRQLDGELYAICAGASMEGSVMLDKQTLSVAGDTQTITAFYFYETLWSRYIQPLFTPEEDEQGEIMLYLGKAEEIDQVYYGAFDLESESLPFDLPALLSELDLIWEA